MLFRKLKLKKCKEVKARIGTAFVVVSLILLSTTVFGADNRQTILKLMADKNWRQAETELIKQLKNNPHDIAVNNNLAITAFNLNKPDQARKYFIKALEANPQTKIAFRNLLQLNSVLQSKRKPFFKPLTSISKQTSEQLITNPTNMAKPIPQIAKPKVKSPKITIAKPAKVKSQAITKASKEEFKVAAKKLESRPPMTFSNQDRDDDLVAKIAAEEPPNSLLTEINQEIDMEFNFDDSSVSGDISGTDNSYLDDLFSEDTTVLDEMAPEPINTSPVDKATESLIIERLNEWSNTWSAGDVENYFKFYSAEYSPAKQSRKSWMKTRRSRISPQREIKVTISDISVTQGNNPNIISTRFLQKYRAKSYRDIGYKTIRWEKQNGAWFIVREKSS